MFAGEIEATKGSASYREQWETLPLPSDYDRIIPAQALGTEPLKQLADLCAGLQIPVPKQWTVVAEQRAIAAVREHLLHTGDDLVALRLRLSGLQGAEGVRGDIDAFIEDIRALDGADGFAAFQVFARQIGSVSLFLARHAGLSDQSRRIEQQAAEVQRLTHLLRGMGEDREAPPLQDGAAVARWLLEARTRYAEYETAYRTSHDAFWAKVTEHPVFCWTEPAVARSRHVGLASLLGETTSLRDRARGARCSRLVDLKFQPQCTCGFSGDAASISPLLEAFESRRQRIERELQAFFAKPPIAERVREWLGMDAGRRTNARDWLEGKEPWPAIDDVGELDRLLDPVEAPRQVSAEDVFAPLFERTWTTAELAQALSAWAKNLGPGRVRFERSPSLVRWCVARTLETGEPLPPELYGVPIAELPGEPTSAALERFESLGLDPARVDALAGRVLRGTLSLPGKRSPLLAAAAEVVEHSHPASVDALAELAARLYTAHPRLAPLATQRWLARLDEVAETPLPLDLPTLVERLAADRDASGFWVDAFGIALLPSLRGELENVLPGFQLAEVGFARVGLTTTTDDCWRALAEAGVRQPIIKCDAIDVLVHAEPTLTFSDLSTRAVAALRKAGKEASSRIDPGGPVLLFADHGFRLAADGNRWVHGGSSTLERVVPVVRYVPNERA